MHVDVPRRPGPSELLGSLVAVARAQWCLRRATERGDLPRVVGRLRVRNRGTLVVGRRFRADGSPLPTKIEVWPGARLVIGDHAFLNYGVDVVATTSVTIGDGVRVAPLVSIVDDAMHDTAPGERRRGPITIGDDVWLGRGAVVLPGVSVGDHAVVAAGSVVTRDVPARTLVAGVPARAVRTLDVPEGWRRR